MICLKINKGQCTQSETIFFSEKKIIQNGVSEKNQVKWNGLIGLRRSSFIVVEFLDELPLSMTVGSVPTCLLDARVSRRNKNKLLGPIVGSKFA